MQYLLWMASCCVSSGTSVPHRSTLSTMRLLYWLATTLCRAQAFTRVVARGVTCHSPSQAIEPACLLRQRKRNAIPRVPDIIKSDMCESHERHYEIITPNRYSTQKKAMFPRTAHETPSRYRVTLSHWRSWWVALCRMQYCAIAWHKN
jgi:hypothetical protein